MVWGQVGELERASVCPGVVGQRNHLESPELSFGGGESEQSTCDLGRRVLETGHGHLADLAMGTPGECGVAEPARPPMVWGLEGGPARSPLSAFLPQTPARRCPRVQRVTHNVWPGNMRRIWPALE